VALLFAASGCAALIYEIVWIQLLEFVIGASAVSTALVLATFMGGLCLGSLELPRLISPTRHPLRVYAALELCIGAVGVLVLSAIPRVGAVYAASVGRGLPGMLLRGTAGAVCLLPPTLLMGATFPAVARWIGTAPERVPWLGFVYSCNIAGSVFGALLAGFYLLRVYDVTTATYVAVSINVGVGLVAVLLATKAQRSSAPLPSRDEPAHSVSRHSPVYLVIAASGACALGAEVVWTRLLALTLGATVYTFSIVLSVFLTGLGIGGGAGSLIARRSRDPQLALGICQLLLAAAIGWTALALGGAIPAWPSDLAGSATPWVAFRLAMLRCLWAILPATALWGASFPLALAAAAGRQEDSGRLAARVYAANSIGAIVGAIACMMAIPFIGTPHVQRALIGLSGISATMAFLTAQSALTRVRRAMLAAVAALAGWLLWSVPGVSPTLISYGRLRSQAAFDAPTFLYVGEGMNSSVAVSELPNGVRRFHVSGKVEASTGLPDMRLQRMLGNIPALLHSNPRGVLVVGFGAGVTAGSFVPYPDLQHLVICEIEPLITRHVANYFADENYHVVNDPRSRVVIDDARHYLFTTRETFDVITSDPIHPWVKGAAALYTEEYFDLVRRHLNRGGIVAQWVPLYESNPDVVKSEIATFFKSFPNGTIWANNDRGQGYDLVLIGQEGAARIDIDAVQQKLERADYQRVAASLHDVDFDSAIELLSTYTGQASDLRPWLRGAEINRDRSLRLQYLAGMAVDSDKNASIYESVVAYRHFPDNVFVGDQASMRTLREAIAEPSTCRLSVDDLNWVQDTLDGWQQISQDAPGVPPAPLPWTVLFDSSCVWHLAPAVGQPPDGTAIHTPLSFASNPVEVRALRHNDTVALPNGLTIPARATAMSSLTSDGISPFVAMALPEVWRLNARDAKAQPANELLQTMMIAELAKSGHRQELQRHLQALAPTQSLPRPIREDTIQMQFQSVPGFREAFEAERDLFFRAAREGDARERNALTMRGLAMARQRRAQYFTGRNRAYAALEDFLLTLDGAGQWAAYQFVKTRVPSAAEADVLQFVRDQRKYWSQEEGLALFLLLNALVPDWQARVFGPAPVPPFALLEDAMRANPGVASR
jgi:spermidine synthase